MDRVEIFNLTVDNITFAEAVSRIIELVEENRKGYVVTANVDHVVRLEKDDEFRLAYDKAALVVTDGMPIVISSRLLGKPIKERITGADLFPALSAVAAEKGFSVFLLGGREGVAALASKKLKMKYPNLIVAGVYSPPFGFEKSDEECQKIIRLVNEAKPNLLFVGVGSPKQEKWTYKYIDELSINVAVCVGGAFDFVAGTVKRAPKFLQRLSLEWFWRLIHEPRRLFRRYIIRDSRFFVILIKELVKRKLGEVKNRY